MAGLTGITVVTVTRRRAEMLRRAMASVDRQDYSGVIEHLIVVDDDRQTINSLAGWESRMQRPVTIEAQGPVSSRQEGSRAFVYPHLARLLNVGISLARFPWIAFLDDDNEFEADHVSSLVALAQETGARAVHSGRAFVWPDGTPYLERHLPSAATLEEGQRLYELLCRRGCGFETPTSFWTESTAGWDLARSTAPSWMTAIRSSLLTRIFGLYSGICCSMCRCLTISHPRKSIKTHVQMTRCWQL